MIRKLFLVILPLILIGCKSVKINDPKGLGDSKITGVCYDFFGDDYKYDLWDYFINAVKSGELMFTYPRAIIAYLVSNVKIIDSKPEVTDVPWYDHAMVIVIIFRWSW